MPTIATANATGDISNPGQNVANYDFGANWNGIIGNVTTVGSAGLLSESFYGTSDQGGNVWEWNETLVTGSSRGLRGGSCNFNEDVLRSSLQNDFVPTGGLPLIGFRVASPVSGAPVPAVSEWAMVVLAVLMLTAGTIIMKKRVRGRSLA